MFRTNEPLRVVPDYLDKVKTNYFLNYFNKSKRKVDHFRIARIQHSCRPMSQTDTETSHHEDNNTSKISNCSFDSDTPSKLAQIEDPE